MDIKNSTNFDNNKREVLELVNALRTIIFPDILNGVRDAKSKFSNYIRKIRPDSLKKYFDVIEYIGKNGSSNMTDLASYLNLSPSTVTNLVDKMIKLNFVKRIIPEDNRRVVILYLDKNGSELYTKFQLFASESAEKILKPLNKGEQELLIQLLKKITQSYHQ